MPVNGGVIASSVLFLIEKILVFSPKKIWMVSVFVLLVQVPMQILLGISPCLWWIQGSLG